MTVRKGQIGLSVLINHLAGNEETVNAYNAALGKVIGDAKMEHDHLLLTFTDGTGIDVFDDGQSCCESRYMMTDDALGDFVGATLIGMELRDGPETEGEYGELHEQQFLLINTSRGTFTMVSHNEHNGYYGGFSVVIRSIDASA